MTLVRHPPTEQRPELPTRNPTALAGYTTRTYTHDRPAARAAADAMWALFTESRIMDAVHRSRAARDQARGETTR